MYYLVMFGSINSFRCAHIYIVCIVHSFKRIIYARYWFFHRKQQSRIDFSRFSCTGINNLAPATLLCSCCCIRPCRCITCVLCPDIQKISKAYPLPNDSKFLEILFFLLFSKSYNNYNNLSGIAVLFLIYAYCSCRFTIILFRNNKVMLIIRNTPVIRKKKIVQYIFSEIITSYFFRLLMNRGQISRGKTH